ncbi:MAG: hypothetical protein KDF49_12885 [Nitrosomonas sp.]|nr:hypothetical protein [Nitrosomonas sp.]
MIRNGNDYARHVVYIHFNPVKHGYVDHAVDWAWSSIHRLTAVKHVGVHKFTSTYLLLHVADRPIEVAHPVLPNDSKPSVSGHSIVPILSIVQMLILNLTKGNNRHDL